MTLANIPAARPYPRPYEWIAPLRSVPRGALALTAVTAFGAVAYGAQAGWPLWAIGLGAVLPWVPVFAFDVLRAYRDYHWLALFYVLAATQVGHLGEHVAQMVQIHVLHMPGPAAHGVFGSFDIEWIHFVWNTWVIVALLVVLSRYPRNTWLWVAAAFATWHQIEHVVIFWTYITTGVAGTPGLLARGGAIASGLPIIRPNLHFLYNLVETTPLVIAFVLQLRRLRVRGVPRRSAA